MVAVSPHICYKMQYCRVLSLYKSGWQLITFRCTKICVVHGSRILNIKYFTFFLFSGAVYLSVWIRTELHKEARICLLNLRTRKTCSQNIHWNIEFVQDRIISKHLCKPNVFGGVDTFVFFFNAALFLWFFIKIMELNTSLLRAFQ